MTALSAHLWQRIHLARLTRATSDDERDSVFSRSAFLTCVNFAPRLGLSERMFGNTVLTPSVDLDSTKLVQAPLWEISKTINSHIRNVSVDEVHKLGSWIAAQSKMSDFNSTCQLRRPRSSRLDGIAFLCTMAPNLMWHPHLRALFSWMLCLMV